ncbi:hypothetical protein MYP_4283 [Sporocytophaga myxococcoides]|uniref:PRC-barrel domain-containing protein n=1 Tax=Sporocytophaga myxococcoides TaxID=153721 RepID=A0A098LLM7_9BACT|nr:PRC-barrel domain-containing protein [Sporocytophaga myxococcoides]GAL87053.1 hypothetical protein MYP_4283 [Sporocytophaga myxococcoides]
MKSEKEKILSSPLIGGDKVKNPEGEDLGEIKEWVMDTGKGKVEYGILSFGGFMGIGNKNFAIPYEALVKGNDNNHFVLNVDKETLVNAYSQIEHQGKSYYIY